MRPLPFDAKTQPDFAALAHMMIGIAHVIHEHFVDAEGIGAHQKRFLRRKQQTLCPALLCEHLCFPEHALRALPEIKNFEIQVRVLGFQLRKCEQPAHQLVHALRLVETHAEILFPHLFLLAEPVLKSLRIALNQGYRGFQLMGDIRDELPPHLIDFFLARKIVAQLAVRFP